MKERIKRVSDAVRTLRVETAREDYTDRVRMHIKSALEIVELNMCLLDSIRELGRETQDSGRGTLD
jgi:hypothetical protein